METCCGVRYGLPPRNAGALGRHLDSRGLRLKGRKEGRRALTLLPSSSSSSSSSPDRGASNSVVPLYATGGATLIIMAGASPPPRRTRSRFGLRRSTSGAQAAPPHPLSNKTCSVGWFGWYRRGFTLSTFSRAGGSARDTKRLFARCSTANRWRSQQRGLLPTDHNLTYGCYGQRPPLKVNELGGLQQPKKEKKALPRATAGVGERVRLLPSTRTGLRTTGTENTIGGLGWARALALRTEP